MGDDVKISEHRVDEEAEGEEEGILEWVLGLPSGDELTPLSQRLVPRELASAFGISPEPHRTFLDVNCASQVSLSNLQRSRSDDRVEFGSDVKKVRRVEVDGQESGPVPIDDARATKKTRLVWTPQLHKRFVEVVSHLGVKNAVPKTIMQLMNVEGLTRENVASHLQKYRIYLKRMQGLCTLESNRLFDSMPVPHVANNFKNSRQTHDIHSYNKFQQRD